MFEVFQSQRYFSLVSKTPLVDVQRLFVVIFKGLRRVPGAAKTVIPYSTSIKNQHFKVLACKTPLGSTFEALWERLEASSQPFWEVFWEPFTHSDRGAGQPNSFLFSPREVLTDFLLLDGLQGVVWVVFAPTFRRSEVSF